MVLMKNRENCLKSSEKILNGYLKTFIKIKDSVISKDEMIKTFKNQQIYY
jgi:hypothetical protein